MNPAHLFILAVLLIIYWLMGLWTGTTDSSEFWPHGPSLLMLFAAVIAAAASIFQLVTKAL